MRRFLLAFTWTSNSKKLVKSGKSQSRLLHWISFSLHHLCSCWSDGIYRLYRNILQNILYRIANLKDTRTDCSELFEHVPPQGRASIYSKTSNTVPKFLDLPTPKLLCQLYDNQSYLPWERSDKINFIACQLHHIVYSTNIRLVLSKHRHYTFLCRCNFWILDYLRVSSDGSSQERKT